MGWEKVRRPSCPALRRSTTPEGTVDSIIRVPYTQCPLLTQFYFYTSI